MVNALLMVAAAGFGFGGSPWIGFAIGAPMAVLLSIPEQLDVLTRYRGQPKTDIVMVILLYLGMAIAERSRAPGSAISLRFCSGRKWRCNGHSVSAS